MKKTFSIGRLIGNGILIILTVIGCSPKEMVPSVEPAITEQEPTETSFPAALKVNGSGISIEEYQTELQRYQSALEAIGEPYDPAVAEQEITDHFINTLLLSTAASQNGYTLDGSALSQEVQDIKTSLGGDQVFEEWMAENAYSLNMFETALAREMAAIWMRNQIIAGVSSGVEQIHARQILVPTENEALGILRQLEVGTSFESLAFEYDPLTGGDLGWFPQGYLIRPEVDEAAFSLQPGQYSGIIRTDYGFHIVEVIERDANHPLTNDALVFIQQKAMDNWLAAQKEIAAIEILTP